MKLLLKIIIFIIPLIIFSFFYLYLSKDNSYPGADYKKFDLPAFELQSLYDENFISNNLLDGTYLVNVWASWCITCRVEHGFLTELSNNNINIVGLNYKDNRDDAIEWLVKYGNPYEVVIHDLKGSLALDMGVTGAPETFLVTDQRVIAHYRGEINNMIWNDVFLPVIKERGLVIDAK